MRKVVGILTAGGDSPGLNAAIRGIGKSVTRSFDMRVIGFRDGFRGLVENRTVRLEGELLSGILTVGGTILGTSRDKPHRMPMGDKNMDMTEVIINNYEKHQLDALVCLGGGGTQKNAFRLHKKGLNIITLPKTIDNDVAMTDATFGFDTALNIATEAIDRLHSTAHSHHRIIVVEVMGHNTGWLALGAGLAGGADVVLIPEIPYQIECVAAAIRQRSRGGKGFSIVAVSEGAMSSEDHKELGALQTKLDKLKRKKAKNNKAAKSTQSAKSKKADKKARQAIKDKIDHLHGRQSDSTLRLTHALEKMTGLESRLTILGHVQRGGIPSPVDRLLATRLGTGCGQLIHDEVFGVMVAARGEGYEAVPLEKVAGNRKTVPIDHPWVESARLLGINLGD